MPERLNYTPFYGARGAWPSSDWCPYWRVVVSVAPLFPQDECEGATRLFEEPYLSHTLAEARFDDLVAANEAGETSYQSVEVQKPDGWVASRPVRLPIYGERPIDRELRAIRAERMFGTWLFNHAEYRAYLDAIDGRKGRSLHRAFWALDILDNPYAFSVRRVMDLLFRHSPCARLPLPSDDDDGDEGDEPEQCGCEECEVREDLEPLSSFLMKQAERFCLVQLRFRFDPSVRARDLEHTCVGNLSPIRAPDTAGVYFVRVEDRVKIGKAVNVRKRIAELQTSSPFRLELVAYVDGGLPEESAMHKHFADLRIIGEWFQLRGPLVAMLLDLNARLVSVGEAESKRPAGAAS